MNCPNCQAELDEKTLFCKVCKAQFFRCQNCGRLFGSWVKNCIYCGGKVVDARFMEFTAVQAPDDAKQFKEPTPKTLRRPKAEGIVKPRFHKVELEITERQPPILPSSQEMHIPESSYAPSEAEFAAQRIITATTEYDEEEVNRKDEAERIAREKERKKAELLNPYWLEKRLALPFYILLGCLFLLFGSVSSRDPFTIARLVDKLGFGLFVVVVSVALVSLIWCVVLIYLDIQRRNRANKL